MADTYGMALALAEIESELGQVFTWEAVDYPCVIGGREETKTLAPDGFDLGADLTLVVRLGILPSVPETQQTVTVNGRILRIVTVTHSPDGQFVVLSLMDNNRGA